jgi:hypothetical protein
MSTSYDRDGVVTGMLIINIHHSANDARTLREQGANRLPSVPAVASYSTSVFCGFSSEARIEAPKTKRTIARAHPVGMLT